MTMNMKQWVADILASDKKKSLPVLSFPSIQKMGITVAELINSSDKQAEGMKIIADSCPTAASVSLMDLSLEAEAFGSTIRVSDDEVPTVIGSIVSTEEEAEALKLMLSKKHANSSQIVRFWQVLSDHSPWQADFWTYPKH